MRKLLMILCATFALTLVVAAPAIPVKQSIKPVYTPEVFYNTEPPVEPEPSAEKPGIYIRPEGLSHKELVEVYFEQQYLAYTSLSPIDLSSILDLRLLQNRNAAAWFEMLILRRKLLAESGLCYVETEQFPYTIRYLSEDELEDERKEFWASGNIAKNDDIVLNFIITGEPGHAYPPIMAVNSQHTMHLREKDGVFNISFHYYPGSVRRFPRNETFEIPSSEDMLAALEEEFSVFSGNGDIIAPNGAKAYSGAYAASYALQYTEIANPIFYDIGDWMGNCANFTSQCVWFGFGNGYMPDMYARENMTANWYGGSGGGSPAWENVDYFWRFATKDIGSRELDGIAQVMPGDIIQTRSGGNASEDLNDFNHSLIVVDEDKLLLAQNSPDCFVYYSDILNVETRFVRPVYLF